MSKSYISRLEAGTRIPSAVVLRHLATVLDVELAELAGDGGGDRHETALWWAEALLACQDGDLTEAISLLDRIPPQPGEDMFTWAVGWLRVLLLSRTADAETVLRETGELLRRWSPGPAADAHAEILRVVAFRRAGRFAESAAAARMAVGAATQDALPAARSVHARALLTLAMELARMNQFTEAEHVVRELMAIIGEDSSDRLTLSAWWVRAQVEDRLGDSRAAARSIGRALELLGDYGGQGSFRTRVELAAASIMLRAPDADLPRIGEALDAIDDAVTGRATELAAQAALLRGELSLRLADAELAWRLGNRALTVGTLDRNDQIRCRLLLARAAQALGDPARAAEANERLARLVDEVGADAVDAIIWRDIARLVLRPVAAPGQVPQRP